MGYNNTMYRLYQEMLDGYATGNEGLFEHGVRCMMALNPQTPFNNNSEEADLFYQTYIHYMRWKNHGADMKISRRRMLAAANELCKLVKKNPYTFDKQEEKEDNEKKRYVEELKRKEQERIEEQKRIDEENRLRAIEEAEERRKQEELERDKTQNAGDPAVAMMAMVKAHNLGDDDTFKEAVTQLMRVSKENPFAPRTEEYDKFLEMMTAYNKEPRNMRRVLVVAAQLSEIINNTEVQPEKEHVLGVLPEEDKEKKNWLKFLFPWRKERDKNDGT